MALLFEMCRKAEIERNRICSLEKKERRRTNLNFKNLSWRDAI
jgi:hypothetical protein